MGGRRGAAVIAEAVVAALEARGVKLRVDGAEIVARPASRVTPEDVAILKHAKSEVVSLLRGRDLGTDWTRVSLYQLDKVLEIEIPGWEVRMILAPGCRIARELRATDPKPGRVWCVCEVSDLLLSGVTPEDARKIAEARLMFDATLDGITKGPGSPGAVGVHDEKEGRS